MKEVARRSTKLCCQLITCTVYYKFAEQVVLYIHRAVGVVIGLEGLFGISLTWWGGRLVKGSVQGKS